MRLSQTKHIQNMRRYFIEKVHAETEGKSRFQKVDFRNQIQLAGNMSAIHRICKKFQENHHANQCDHDLVRSLATIDWKRDQCLNSIGEFTPKTRAYLPICAAPELLQKYPNLKILLIGAGAMREYLEALVYLLNHGRKKLFFETLNAILLKDRASETKKRVRTFFQKLKKEKKETAYFEAAQGKIADQIIFTGALNAEDLKWILPLSRKSKISHYLFKCGK
ncbi:MAG: hypothetical protein A3B70_00645 [Deltaproteobacteria bacterium RIFCSPHIGHO2_02_FULL_40_11]|nr:MAG: hypothetical protein A3B70_00645 [Deltaproteobacteria bacterium RIFCSPHIGHO2_02_FULL_40_11]